jgi:tetratricopeptide (TPR) repeat protein
MKTKILQRFYICLLTGLVGGLLLYGNGCQFRRPFLKKHQPVNIKTSTPVSKLEQAALLQKTGNDLEAVMLYREAILCSRNRNEVDLAKIGAAECLIKSKKFPAALAVLEPLSAEIITENEMRKLALAGEILLHLGRTKEAEACLEAALGVLDLETLLDQVHSEDALEFDAWIPAATANLGCAILTRIRSV